MNTRRYELALAGVAAALLVSAGAVVWGTKRAAPLQHVREVRVAWRCADGADAGTCRAVSDVERCTSCHETSAHPRRPVLVERHAAIGCVACHGGDGLASEKSAAHAGLARLGSGEEVPEVQARCAACHAETRAEAAAPAKAAWAKWVALREDRAAPEAPSPVDTTELAPSLVAGRRAFRSLRCGACHAARDASPIATPLAVLGLRGSPVEVARALGDHAARAGVDLGLDETTGVAVATHLASIAAQDESTAMVHRASVPGSSAEEGKVLYERLACAACHEPGENDGRLHVDLGSIATTRTPDWVAFFSSDPARANPAATMPSLRLTPREAASLAAHLAGKHDAALDARGAARSELVACKIPGGETKSLARDACGEAVVAAAKCVACHASALDPRGPSLAGFGEGRDGPSALAKLVDHAGFHFDAETKRDLATYLLSQREVNVRPGLRVAARPGEASFVARGCAGCHALDDASVTAPGPSLFGEGLRTQPQWLFDFLREPQRNPVRPALHPELAYRDLVAPDHVAPRMPTYALDEAEATALVRFFARRDGATYPYATVTQVALAVEALTSALGDLERKDRGDCTSCHTVGPPDVARAREEAAKLAPPLALAHRRLRPAWIEACVVEPDTWVHGMPAFAPAARDAGARPAFDEVDRLRDLVLLLRDRTVLPPPGQEATVPALGLGDLP